MRGRFALLIAIVVIVVIGSPRIGMAEKCAALEASQREEPDPETQWELAGCYADHGKVASAWNLFKKLGRTDPDMARRKQATERAAKLAPRVPKLLLKSSRVPTI